MPYLTRDPEDIGAADAVHTHVEADITDLGPYDPAGTAASAIAGHETDTTAHPADGATYDNATSGLTATDVRAALDEVLG